MAGRIIFSADSPRLSFGIGIPVSLTWAASKQNSSGGARSVLMTRLEPLPSTADRQYREIVDSVAFDIRGPGASSSSGLQAARD